MKMGVIVMDLSWYRLKLRRLCSEEMKFVPIFLRRKPLLRGGIYKTKTKCGKKGCRCQREGKLHIVWRFYSSDKGKTKIKTLKRGDILTYQKFTQNYRRFRQARARLVKIHREKIRLINLIENGLSKRKEIA